MDPEALALAMLDLREQYPDDDDFAVAAEHLLSMVEAQSAGQPQQAPATPGRPPAQQFATERAPPGGVSVQGTDYVGGQFIPSEVMQRATPAEQAAVRGGRRAAAPPPGTARANVHASDATRAAAASLLGRDVSDDDLAAFACAPAGSNVQASYSGGKLYVTGWSSAKDENGQPLFTATRAVYKPWFGPLTCENKTFGLRGGAKGQGAALFAGQVEALQKAGVKRIVCSAAGGPDGGGNGYYTWPRLGYGGPMTSSQIARLPEDLRKQLGKKTDVRDLFDLPGGPEAWKKHGGGLARVTFDLTPGSRNMKALEAYQAQKAKEK